GASLARGDAVRPAVLRVPRTRVAARGGSHRGVRAGAGAAGLDGGLVPRGARSAPPRRATRLALLPARSSVSLRVAPDARRGWVHDPRVVPGVHPPGGELARRALPRRTGSGRRAGERIVSAAEPRGRLASYAPLLAALLAVAVLGGYLRTGLLLDD